jgi:hypothetical protein
MCHQLGYIIENRSAIQTALSNINVYLSLKYNTTSLFNPAVDVRILACALQTLMRSGLSKERRLKGNGILPVVTAEGIYRKVKGKHVIVSMGSKGVLWCGPKGSVLRNRAGRTITSHLPHSSSSDISQNEESTDIVTVIIDDLTAVKLFSSHSTLSQTLSSNPIMFSTNGAGDAFCAGVVSEMLESSCDELDTECILSGLNAATNKIIQNMK